VTPDGWNGLAALAEAEVRLAREGRWELLPAALATRAAASATLGQAPAAARPALERLAAAQEQLLGLLQEGRATTVAELSHLRQGRAAVRGYGPADAPGRPLGAG
jgi:hypothetical protein